MIAQNCLGQAVDFADGKSLKLASGSEFLRVEELIRDRNGLAAARQLSQIVEASGDQLFVLRVNNGRQVFVTGYTKANQLACLWAKTAPDALAAYRDLVDTEAKALLEQAKKESDIQALKWVANKYFVSRVGDEATDLLARHEFECGRFVTAAKLWNSLIPIADFSGPALHRYPDSNLDLLGLMTRSLAADLLAQRWDQVARKQSYLEREHSDDLFDFLGKSGMSLAELKQQILLERKSLELDTRDVPAKVLDIKGRESLSVALERQSKASSPFFRQVPTVSDPAELSISTIPVFRNGLVWWCDTHHIYQCDSVFGQAPVEPIKIWSTLFPDEVVETNRKRIGRAVFDLNVGSRYLFARMGDPRTSYRNDEVTRNRSYLIGLDLQRDGEVLPGFPMKNDDPRVEFDATPVEDKGRVFVVRRKTFRDNATSQLTLQCLELSRSRRTDELPVVWESRIVEAETNNRGLWDEVSRTRTICFENWVILVGLGFVAVHDQGTGRIEWVAEYERDRFVFPGENSKSDHAIGPVVRSRDEVVADKGQLFVAPSDSNQIYCFHMESGTRLWNAKFASCSHLLGISGSSLVAGGNAIHWIDRTNGRLNARFPAEAGENQVGFGIRAERGLGRGYIDGQWLYWPTLNKIYVVHTKWERQGSPRLRRVIDLQMRNATGGNLCIGDGIMLIANEKEIKAFGE